VVFGGEDGRTPGGRVNPCLAGARVALMGGPGFFYIILKKSLKKALQGRHIGLYSCLKDNEKTPTAKKEKKDERQNLRNRN